MASITKAIDCGSDLIANKYITSLEFTVSAEGLKECTQQAMENMQDGYFCYLECDIKTTSLQNKRTQDIIYYCPKSYVERYYNEHSGFPEGCIPIDIIAAIGGVASQNIIRLANSKYNNFINDTTSSILSIRDIVYDCMDYVFKNEK